MNEKQKAIAAGVESAFDCWLAQHDISFPSLIERAMQASFDRWLEKNTDTIAERVAEKIAAHRQEGQTP